MAIFRNDDTPMIDRYRWWEIVLIYCGAFAFLFFLLSPFIEGFLVSLKPLSQLFSSPYTFWPENGSFEAYSNLWKTVPGFARYVFNSFLISTIATIIVLLLVVPAAYAFARFRFRGMGLVLAAFLAVSMFSGAVLLIPLFRLMRMLGLLNTYWAMIVPGAAFLIPSAIWLLRTYMMRIPAELNEAAYMDGASQFYTFRRVILPLAAPALASFAVLEFIWVWNDLLVATIFAPSTSLPITQSLNSLSGTWGDQWFLQAAGTFISILVPLIVFFLLQRFFVRGLLAGATKG